MVYESPKPLAAPRYNSIPPPSTVFLWCLDSVVYYQFCQMIGGTSKVPRIPLAWMVNTDKVEQLQPYILFQG